VSHQTNITRIRAVNSALGDLRSTLFHRSKLEAFNARGKGDGRTSTDFEDIVFVLENRRSVWQEMKVADETVRAFLLNEFKTLRANRYIREWIDGHSSSYSPPGSYFILSDMDEFIR
jgi:hypothetical protein